MRREVAFRIAPGRRSRLVVDERLIFLMLMMVSVQGKRLRNLSAVVVGIGPLGSGLLVVFHEEVIEVIELMFTQILHLTTLCYNNR